jgi:hypothetical protein
MSQVDTVMATAAAAPADSGKEEAVVEEEEEVKAYTNGADPADVDEDAETGSDGARREERVVVSRRWWWMGRHGTLWPDCAPTPYCGGAPRCAPWARLAGSPGSSGAHPHGACPLWRGASAQSATDGGAAGTLALSCRSSSLSQM